MASSCCYFISKRTNRGGGAWKLGRECSFLLKGFFTVAAHLGFYWEAFKSPNARPHLSQLKQHSWGQDPEYQILSVLIVNSFTTVQLRGGELKLTAFCIKFSLIQKNLSEIIYHH